MNKPNPPAITRLLGTDRQQSVLLAFFPRAHHQAYNPYGHCPARHSALAFNGERLDLPTGQYFLGNGYRAFNTVLMRFHRPDDLSPFSSGGLNAYAYCEGEPINRSDPSGHGFRRWLYRTFRAVTGRPLPPNYYGPPPRTAVGLPPLRVVPTLKTLAAARMPYYKLTQHVLAGRIPVALYKEVTPGRRHTHWDWVRMQDEAPLPPSLENVQRTQKMIRENLDIILASKGQGQNLTKTQKVMMYPSVRHAELWARAEFEGERLLQQV